MNWTYKDQNENKTAIYDPNTLRATAFIPKLHPDHDKNRDLIVDTLNTIQICDRLPSQLLEERNELFGALLDLQAAQNGPPLEREKEYWQACMDRATKIINKIENGK